MITYALRCGLRNATTAALGGLGAKLHHLRTELAPRPSAPASSALRDAMGLSLRELAERSGVSSAMLSQVERGETSPTLAVAERIAAGLELSLSQLLRLDEGQHVAVSRAGARRRYRGAAATVSRS